MEAQNKITVPFLEQCPIRGLYKERMTELYDYPKYSCNFKKGKRYVNLLSFHFLLFSLNFTVQIPNNLPVYKHYKINSFLCLTMKIVFFFWSVVHILKRRTKKFGRDVS